ncbi:T9SS type A sorting domain-containing protein [Chryseobacterium rhizosphaerae]|uniref:T9SS type A sorting domain-containing protein n=1 Tax=Chryseobacterium rhizosphaerae TaxID=395937 RepID=UPI002359003E|nr:T9SS type A sorting domain-containing protein [Chryseobacterium rhizosphaerae]MDC8101801.1 T9SS type A sorting domain-containing protein [Chryseobacterium rhizosphaerae]
MKTYLLAGCTFRKAILFPLLVFMTNTLLYAQQVYVSNQSIQYYGACLGCSVQDAENVVGPNENNYASMQIPLGVFARIGQTLFFPSVKTYSKVVIGIGTNQAGLSVQLLGGIAVETFNGNLSNNDYKIVNNEILKIGVTDPSKGTIEFNTAKPYDRIVLYLNSGVLLNGGLQVYYAYQLDRVYANSETHVAQCPGCAVQNPQNAVGSNEVDFSKLIQSPSGTYTVRQDLHFPTFKPSTKLVIGVSNDSKPIDQVIDKEVLIAITKNGNYSGIVSGGLKKDPQNPYKGTIEFITSSQYDGVFFDMVRSLYSTNDLKIHYVCQENLYNPALSNNTVKADSTEKVITLFPNPTTGQITLEGNIVLTDADIFISNTLGKEVFRSKFRSKTIDLPATLPEGIYLMTLQTQDGKVYTHKIILTK